MVTNCSDYPWFVQVFFDDIDAHEADYGPDIWKLRRLIEKTFQTEKLDIRLELAEKYRKLEKYLPFKLMPVQYCALYCWMCVYDENGLPRWPDLVLCCGRGFGKTGTMTVAQLFLTSPFNPVKNYDIDIVATSEDQALTSFRDLYDILDTHKALEKYWNKKKSLITGLSNGGTVKVNTSNAKTKDGKRTSCVMFDEYHAYPNEDLVSVFITGQGKKPDSRTGIFTTDGDVVGGPMDDLKNRMRKILDGSEPDYGLLPFWFHLESAEEVMSPEMWIRANPMLRYSPSLKQKIVREFQEYKENPDKHAAFSTKRMNFRRLNREVAVTSWENIEATNRQIPDLTGKACVVGIDYAKTSDWVGINAHFRDGEIRYDINHAFVCRQGADFSKLKCPVNDWEKAGLVTIIDEPDIRPSVVQDYLLKLKKKYSVRAVAIDSYRWTLLSESIQALGFSEKNGTLKLLRNPSSEILISPLIDSIFSNQNFIWGDNPVLRWATNNTKLVPQLKSKIAESSNTGNYRYGKIEPIKRKTDPFMALVASVCVEDKLPKKLAGNRAKIFSV